MLSRFVRKRGRESASPHTKEGSNESIVRPISSNTLEEPFLPLPPQSEVSRPGATLASEGCLIDLFSSQEVCDSSPTREPSPILFMSKTPQKVSTVPPVAKGTLEGWLKSAPKSAEAHNNILVPSSPHELTRPLSSLAGVASPVVTLHNNFQIRINAVPVRPSASGDTTNLQSSRHLSVSAVSTLPNHTACGLSNHALHDSTALSRSSGRTGRSALVKPASVIPSTCARTHDRDTLTDNDDAGTYTVTSVDMDTSVGADVGARREISRLKRPCVLSTATTTTTDAHHKGPTGVMREPAPSSPVSKRSRRSYIVTYSQDSTHHAANTYGFGYDVVGRDDLRSLDRDSSLHSSSGVVDTQEYDIQTPTTLPSSFTSTSTTSHPATSSSTLSSLSCMSSSRYSTVKKQKIVSSGSYEPARTLTWGDTDTDSSVSQNNGSQNDNYSNNGGFMSELFANAGEIPATLEIEDPTDIPDSHQDIQTPVVENPKTSREIPMPVENEQRHVQYLDFLSQASQSADIESSKSNSHSSGHTGNTRARTDMPSRVVYDGKDGGRHVRVDWDGGRVGADARPGADDNSVSTVASQISVASIESDISQNSQNSHFSLSSCTTQSPLPSLQSTQVLLFSPISATTANNNTRLAPSTTVKARTRSRYTATARASRACAGICDDSDGVSEGEGDGNRCMMYDYIGYGDFASDHGDHGVGDDCDNGNGVDSEDDHDGVIDCKESNTALSGLEDSSCLRTQENSFDQENPYSVQRTLFFSQEAFSQSQSPYLTSSPGRTRTNTIANSNDIQCTPRADLPLSHFAALPPLPVNEAEIEHGCHGDNKDTDETFGEESSLDHRVPNNGHGGCGDGSVEGDGLRSATGRYQGGRSDTSTNTGLSSPSFADSPLIAKTQVQVMSPLVIKRQKKLAFSPLPSSMDTIANTRTHMDTSKDVDISGHMGRSWDASTHLSRTTIANTALSCAAGTRNGLPLRKHQNAIDAGKSPRSRGYYSPFRNISNPIVNHPKSTGKERNVPVPAADVLFQKNDCDVTQFDASSTSTTTPINEVTRTHHISALSTIALGKNGENTTSLGDGRYFPHHTHTNNALLSCTQFPPDRDATDVGMGAHASTAHTPHEPTDIGHIAGAAASASFLLSMDSPALTESNLRSVPKKKNSGVLAPVDVQEQPIIPTNSPFSLKQRALPLVKTSLLSGFGESGQRMHNIPREEDLCVDDADPSVGTGAKKMNGKKLPSPPHIRKKNIHRPNLAPPQRAKHPSAATIPSSSSSSRKIGLKDFPHDGNVPDTRHSPNLRANLNSLQSGVKKMLAMTGLHAADSFMMCSQDPMSLALQLNRSISRISSSSFCSDGSRSGNRTFGTDSFNSEADSPRLISRKLNLSVGNGSVVNDINRGNIGGSSDGCNGGVGGSRDASMAALKTRPMPLDSPMYTPALRDGRSVSSDTAAGACAGIGADMRTSWRTDASKSPTRATKNKSKSSTSKSSTSSSSSSSSLSKCHTIPILDNPYIISSSAISSLSPWLQSLTERLEKGCLWTRVVAGNATVGDIVAVFEGFIDILEKQGETSHCMNCRISEDTEECDNPENYAFPEEELALQHSLLHSLSHIMCTAGICPVKSNNDANMHACNSTDHGPLIRRLVSVVARLHSLHLRGSTDGGERVNGNAAIVADPSQGRLSVASLSASILDITLAHTCPHIHGSVPTLDDILVEQLLHRMVETGIDAHLSVNESNVPVISASAAPSVRYLLKCLGKVRYFREICGSCFPVDCVRKGDVFESGNGWNLESSSVDSSSQQPVKTSHTDISPKTLARILSSFATPDSAPSTLNAPSTNREADFVCSIVCTVDLVELHPKKTTTTSSGRDDKINTYSSGIKTSPENSPILPDSGIPASTGVLITKLEPFVASPAVGVDVRPYNIPVDLFSTWLPPHRGAISGASMGVIDFRCDDIDVADVGVTDVGIDSHTKSDDVDPIFTSTLHISPPPSTFASTCVQFLETHRPDISRTIRKNNLMILPETSRFSYASRESVCSLCIAVDIHGNMWIRVLSSSALHPLHTPTHAREEEVKMAVDVIQRMVGQGLVSAIAPVGVHGVDVVEGCVVADESGGGVVKPSRCGERTDGCEMEEGDVARSMSDTSLLDDRRGISMSASLHESVARGVDAPASFLYTLKHGLLALGLHPTLVRRYAPTLTPTNASVLVPTGASSPLPTPMPMSVPSSTPTSPCYAPSALTAPSSARVALFLDSCDVKYLLSLADTLTHTSSQTHPPTHAKTWAYTQTHEEHTITLSESPSSFCVRVMTTGSSGPASTTGSADKDSQYAHVVSDTSDRDRRTTKKNSQNVSPRKKPNSLLNSEKSGCSSTSLSMSRKKNSRAPISIPSSFLLPLAPPPVLPRPVPRISAAVFLAPYRVLRTSASGSFSSVSKAVENASGRSIAVKKLIRTVISQTAIADLRALHEYFCQSFVYASEVTKATLGMSLSSGIITANSFSQPFSRYQRRHWNSHRPSPIFTSPQPPSSRSASCSPLPPIRTAAHNLSPLHTHNIRERILQPIHAAIDEDGSVVNLSAWASEGALSEYIQDSVNIRGISAKREISRPKIPDLNKLLSACSSSSCSLSTYFPDAPPLSLITAAKPSSDIACTGSSPSSSSLTAPSSVAGASANTPSMSCDISSTTSACLPYAPSPPSVAASLSCHQWDTAYLQWRAAAIAQTPILHLSPPQYHAITQLLTHHSLHSLHQPYPPISSPSSTPFSTSTSTSTSTSAPLIPVPLRCLLPPQPPSPPPIFCAFAATQLLQQLCEALAQMHSRGVAHMDVKPDNILLESIPVDIAREKASTNFVQGCDLGNTGRANTCSWGRTESDGDSLHSRFWYNYDGPIEVPKYKEIPKDMEIPDQEEMEYNRFSAYQLHMQRSLTSLLSFSNAEVTQGISGINEIATLLCYGDRLGGSRPIVEENMRDSEVAEAEEGAVENWNSFLKGDIQLNAPAGAGIESDAGASFSSHSSCSSSPSSSSSSPLSFVLVDFGLARLFDVSTSLSARQTWLNALAIHPHTIAKTHGDTHRYAHVPRYGFEHGYGHEYRHSTPKSESSLPALSTTCHCIHCVPTHLSLASAAMENILTSFHNIAHPQYTDVDPSNCTPSSSGHNRYSAMLIPMDFPKEESMVSLPYIHNMAQLQKNLYTFTTTSLLPISSLPPPPLPLPLYDIATATAPLPSLLSLPASFTSWIPKIHQLLTNLESSDGDQRYLCATLLQGTMDKNIGKNTFMDSFSEKDHLSQSSLLLSQKSRDAMDGSRATMTLSLLDSLLPFSPSSCSSSTSVFASSGSASSSSSSSSSVFASSSASPLPLLQALSTHWRKSKYNIPAFSSGKSTVFSRNIKIPELWSMVLKPPLSSAPPSSCTSSSLSTSTPLHVPPLLDAGDIFAAGVTVMEAWSGLPAPKDGLAWRAIRTGRSRWVEQCEGREGESAYKEGKEDVEEMNEKKKGPSSSSTSHRYVPELDEVLFSTPSPLPSHSLRHPDENWLKKAAKSPTNPLLAHISSLILSMLRANYQIRATGAVLQLWLVLHLENMLVWARNLALNQAISEDHSQLSNPTAFSTTASSSEATVRVHDLYPDAPSSPPQWAHISSISSALERDDQCSCCSVPASLPPESSSTSSTAGHSTSCVTDGGDVGNGHGGVPNSPLTSSSSYIRRQALVAHLVHSSSLPSTPSALASLPGISPPARPCVLSQWINTNIGLNTVDSVSLGSSTDNRYSAQHPPHDSSLHRSSRAAHTAINSKNDEWSFSSSGAFAKAHIKHVLASSINAFLTPWLTATLDAMLDPRPVCRPVAAAVAQSVELARRQVLKAVTKVYDGIRRDIHAAKLVIVPRECCMDPEKINSGETDVGPRGMAYVDEVAPYQRVLLAPALPQSSSSSSSSASTFSSPSACVPAIVVDSSPAAGDVLSHMHYTHNLLSSINANSKCTRDITAAKNDTPADIVAFRRRIVATLCDLPTGMCALNWCTHARILAFLRNIVEERIGRQMVWLVLLPEF